MNDAYRLDAIDEVLSPSILLFRPIMLENLRLTEEIAGGTARLRPHCKTHKMREIAEIQIARGVTKHKCATFAEAEMLANAGAADIFLAYNLVGPNIGRACEFRRRFPHVAFSVTADHPLAIEQLSQAAVEADVDIGVLLDLDTGQHRTGLPCDERAVEAYRAIDSAAGLRPEGFHLYDGQNHQTDLADRTAAVNACWNEATDLKQRCEAAGLAVPRIVCGGTGSFPVFAKLEDPCIELSPGTTVFYDVGYGQMFPDLPFQPAALLLTRVISRPTANRVTFDLGYKAVASDPPAEKRVQFPTLPDAQIVLQNEEHLVVETQLGRDLQPGDWALAIPRHTCPTSALHRSVYVVENGKVVDQWQVAARDRMLTI